MVADSPDSTDVVRVGRWLALAGIATWLVCGLPPLAEILAGPVTWPGALFVAAFLVYGAALLALLRLVDVETRRTAIAIVLLLVESVTAVTMVAVSGRYLGGTGATSATAVIVAAQAPYLLPVATVWLLVACQTAAMMALVFWQAPPAQIVSIGVAFGGFQAFAAASSFLARREAAGRAALARTNAELRAAQSMLARTSRTDERLRIARDLHDTLGHHLTALSLQLDVASRVTDGKAADHVRQAHAIARLLLSDVRDVVGTLRASERMDVGEALRALAATPAPPEIHLDAPPQLSVPDVERGQALLRCVQEIITNATRHAHARNLWIRLEQRPDGISLHARDDGRGTSQVRPGHGLTGMRERFAACDGSIEFASHPDSGFEVRGFMPLPRSA